MLTVCSTASSSCQIFFSNSGYMSLVQSAPFITRIMTKQIWLQHDSRTRVEHDLYSGCGGGGPGIHHRFDCDQTLLVFLIFNLKQFTIFV